MKFIAENGYEVEPWDVPNMPTGLRISTESGALSLAITHAEMSALQDYFLDGAGVSHMDVWTVYEIGHDHIVVTDRKADFGVYRRNPEVKYAEYPYDAKSVAAEAWFDEHPPKVEQCSEKVNVGGEDYLCRYDGDDGHIPHMAIVTGSQDIVVYWGKHNG